MWHAYYQDNGPRLEHKDTVVYQVIYITNELYKIRNVIYNRATTRMLGKHYRISFFFFDLLAESL